VRCIYNMQLAKHFPPVFIVEMVYASVLWRNMFALKGGISTTQSPAEFILNRKVDYNAHCKIKFGDYMQTHEEHDNTMSTRTFGAIATRPTGNIQGRYYFIRLDTGRCITRRDWTPLPMPSEVVNQIHRLAHRVKDSKINCSRHKIFHGSLFNMLSIKNNTYLVDVYSLLLFMWLHYFCITYWLGLHLYPLRLYS
jgi:hypothetical protein